MKTVLEEIDYMCEWLGIERHSDSIMLYLLCRIDGNISAVDYNRCMALIKVPQPKNDDSE